jgi:hypothetical protein
MSLNSNCNHPQNCHYLKAALRDVPLPTHNGSSIVPKAELQRKVKGLRTFAQSLLTDRLEIGKCRSMKTKAKSKQAFLVVYSRLM